jgi:isocitrate lyase
MKTLVVTSDNVKELKVLQYLAEKMGMETEVLSKDDKEDIGLLKAMLDGRKGDYVREDEVLKVLRKK